MENGVSTSATRERERERKKSIYIGSLFDEVRNMVTYFLLPSRMDRLLQKGHREEKRKAADVRQTDVGGRLVNEWEEHKLILTRYFLSRCSKVLSTNEQLTLISLFLSHSLHSLFIDHKKSLVILRSVINWKNAIWQWKRKKERKRWRR